MGTRGPAPTPDKLRLIKGNNRDRDVAGRKVGRQPKAVAAIPPMPAGLGDNGDRMWHHVTPELARMGVLGATDLGTLEMYCRLYQEIYEHGGGRGFPTLVMTFVNVGSKLGLDPAARLRMTLPEVADDEEGRIFGSG